MGTSESWGLIEARRPCRVTLTVSCERIRFMSRAKDEGGDDDGDDDDVWGGVKVATRSS